MEKLTPKMAATFGLGFVGFIVAAYSYNKHHKPSYTSDLIEHHEINEDIDNNLNNIDDNTDTNKIISKITDEENIVLEVNDEITKKKETWKDFWRDEYDNIRFKGRKTRKNLKKDNLEKTNNKLKNKTEKNKNDIENELSDKDVVCNEDGEIVEASI